MKKLLTIIEQAKAGADIDPDDRRYVRSWVAGHEDATADVVINITKYFLKEYNEGMQLQNL